MNYPKNISRLLSLILVVFLGGVLVAHAVGYVPLAPLPIGEGGAIPKEYSSMGTYLAGMMKLIIALGGVIAIVMAIIGGVQRIASGISPSGKEAANTRIENALIGLGLVLTSYLLLNSINPNLVKLNLDLTPLKGETRKKVALTAEEQLKNNIGIAVSTMDTSLFPEDYWGNDKYWRDKLRDGGVTVQRPNSCKKIGEENCTSVSNLGQRAIDGLIKLASDCKCTPIITGGTEFWLHGNRSTNINNNPTKHKPGNSVVDLSRNSVELNRYIINSSNLIQKTEIKNSQEESIGTQYDLKGGGSYLDEKIPGNKPHWHVTF